MFSKACEYGIRAVIYIMAESREDKKVSIKDISKATDAPEYFTAKILQNLVRMQIIGSLKGPTGGFYIGEEHRNVALIDLVRAIDGPELFTGCGLGLKACSETNPCPIHFQFKDIREQLHDMLETTKIADLTEELLKGNAYLRRA